MGDVYIPHSASSGTSYFIRSLDGLRALIAAQEWPEIDITIRRTSPYPVRGRVTPKLIETALGAIADGAQYVIVGALAEFPSSCGILGGGHSHDELRRELADLAGTDVAIGLDPNPTYAESPEAESRRRTDEFFMLTVTKNQNHYPPYVAEPERYNWLQSLWSGAGPGIRNEQPDARRYADAAREGPGANDDSTHACFEPSHETVSRIRHL